MAIRSLDIPLRKALLFTEAPPVFLTPALASPVYQHRSTLHTSSPVSIRRKDNNPNRGVSPLRRTGLKEPLYKLSVGQAVAEQGLPKPVESDQRSKLEVDPDHGLWEFFNERNLLTDPEQDYRHGRAWDKEELKNKTFEELHQLWYLCVKDRNRIATEHAERERLKLSGGIRILLKRDQTLRKTMKAIKWALTERWYAWEDAWKMAQNDPDIDLNTRDGETPIYLPKRDAMHNFEMD